MKRIEICGGIASGKTTLANVLGSIAISVVRENFRKNPFWRLFYRDPGKFAFETEVTFLLQHYHQLKSEIPQKGTIVTDFSFILDRGYSQVNLSGSQLKVFNCVFNQISSELPSAVLIVHLRCAAEEELRRIVARSRTEEAAITVEYLQRINDVVAALFRELPDNVAKLEIDSEAIDFAHDEVAMARVAAQVLEALKE